MARIEVKTRRKAKNRIDTRKDDFGIVMGEWQVSPSSEKLDEGLVYCFVNVSEKGEFEFYVVPSADVARAFAREARIQGIKGPKGKWEMALV